MGIYSEFVRLSSLPWYEWSTALGNGGAAAAGVHVANVTCDSPEYLAFAFDNFHHKTIPMNEYWAGISGILIYVKRIVG